MYLPCLVCHLRRAIKFFSCQHYWHSAFLYHKNSDQAEKSATKCFSQVHDNAKLALSNMLRPSRSRFRALGTGKWRLPFFWAKGTNRSRGKFLFLGSLSFDKNAQPSYHTWIRALFLRFRSECLNPVTPNQGGKINFMRGEQWLAERPLLKEKVLNFVLEQ